MLVYRYKEITMAHNRYLTVESIVEALTAGVLAQRTASQLIQYHKNKGNNHRADMFKEALVLTKDTRKKNT